MKEVQSAYNGYTGYMLTGEELKEMLKGRYLSAYRHHSTIIGIQIQDYLTHIGVEDSEMYTIYGEGYGMKIQKGGGRYLSNSVSFRGFDVKVNDLYLLRDNAMEIFNKLGCDTVPYLGQMTIDEAIDFVRAGFISTISEDRTLMAEGVVLTSPLGLKNRRGERLIVKIKYEDFVKYRNKYGTNEKVEQISNPKL